MAPGACPNGPSLRAINARPGAAARCANAPSGRNGGAACLSRNVAAAAARAPRGAGEIPRHRAGRHRVLHDQHLVPAETPCGAHRRFRAQLPAGGPGRTCRQDQPPGLVRRSRVPGQRPQRKPRGGGDHRPRRKRTRTATAARRGRRRRRTGRQFYRRAAYARALFCFLVAVRGFRARRVRRGNARPPGDRGGLWRAARLSRRRLARPRAAPDGAGREPFRL